MDAIRRFYFERPPRVAHANYRTFATLGSSLTAAICIHLLLVLPFAALGAWPLVWFNGLSLLMYLAAIILNRRGYHFTTILVAEVELILHQSLCVWVLGWGAGFQYYLLAITGVVFFLPKGRPVVKILMLSGAALSYVALMTASESWQPTVIMHPTVLDAIRDFNVIVVFGFLGLFSWLFNRAAVLAEHRADVNHQKVVTLLHSILPIPIAHRLTDRREIIADAIPQATVLFADIVDFTPLSARLGPNDIVSMLNDVFTELDELADKHGLEKIKTIGDAYMVAGGVPVHRSDHARATALFALDVQQRFARWITPIGTPLKMRIGIHTGPVVAGVIGSRKFIYDLWGDTVNTASRMESHGIAGRIQVTDEVRNALGDDFILEDRGLVMLKGRGPVRAWFLIGARVPTPTETPARA